MNKDLNKVNVLVVCPNPSIDIYAAIDGFNIGSTTRIKNESRYPGGKGVHVAMALSELDIHVTLVGFWGGVTGEWVKNEITKIYPDIKIDGVNIPGWTRSCYTFKSTNSDDDSELLGAGPEISPTDYNNFLGIVMDYLSNSSALVLSGSWPLGAPSNGYAQLIKLAKSYNVKSFLDCTGEQFNNALKEEPFLIHLNRHEVMVTTGITDFDRARKRISKMVNNCVITNGDKGVYYNTKETEVHSVYRIKDVVSTIGSGDCLLAGIVAGHLKDLPIQEIANLGAACGAANCMRKELGMLHKSDLQMLLSQDLE